MDNDLIQDANYTFYDGSEKGTDYSGQSLSGNGHSGIEVGVDKQGEDGSQTPFVSFRIEFQSIKISCYINFYQGSADEVE